MIFQFQCVKKSVTTVRNVQEPQPLMLANVYANVISLADIVKIVQIWNVKITVFAKKGRMVTASASVRRNTQAETVNEDFVTSIVMVMVNAVSSVKIVAHAVWTQTVNDNAIASKTTLVLDVKSRNVIVENVLIRIRANTATVKTVGHAISLMTKRYVTARLNGQATCVSRIMLLITHAETIVKIMPFASWKVCRHRDAYVSVNGQEIDVIAHHCALVIVVLVSLVALSMNACEYNKVNRRLMSTNTVCFFFT